MRLVFPDSKAAEISRTALVPNPKLVKPAIIPVVAVSMPEIPIPTGPKRTAMNLERTIEITILISCIPPKIEVAFIICL